MVLWVLDEQGVWVPVELKGATQQVGIAGITVEVSSDIVTPVALLYPWRDRHGTTRYVLFPARAQHPAKISVNGYPLLDLMVLGDQAAITFTTAGQRCRTYFSTEARPQTVSYQPAQPGATSPQPVVCMRCKGKIEPGHAVVQCSRCSLWYHQMEGRPCWTYDQRCAGCQRPTTMEYAWAPAPVRHGTKASRNRESVGTTHDRKRSSATI
jgi:hypothetical protein